MNTMLQILSIVAVVFIVWYLLKTFRQNPAIFSKANFNKSLGTMGFLAIGLIAFIALLVMLLRISG